MNKEYVFFSELKGKKHIIQYKLQVCTVSVLKWYGVCFLHME